MLALINSVAAFPFELGPGLRLQRDLKFVPEVDSPPLIDPRLIRTVRRTRRDRPVNANRVFPLEVREHPGDLLLKALRIECFAVVERGTSTD